MTIEHWTDERLDRLAAITESNTRLIESNTRLIESNSRLIESNSSQILGLRESITELRESSREQREDIAATQITTTALLQLAQQNQQKWDLSQARHEESDQRFEVLLAEVRHLIARLDGG